MKKILLFLISVIVLSGCTDKKAQEKALLDDVIKIHDKVMGVDEQLMDNKMKLDTLSRQGKLAANDTVKMLIVKLAAADSVMGKWMHNFDPDHKGKSEDETITYMNSQKKQLMAIDSQINAAIAQSNKYLVKIKGK